MGKGKGKKMVRQGNFMSEPEGGWLHNENALAHGDGVFYSFPVRYIGSVQVLQSLRGLEMDEKTVLCSEAIYRCIDVSKVVKSVKRKKKKFIKEYLADAPYVKVMELRLNLSVEGIATSNLNSPEIISNDPIDKISFAAGGSHDRAYSFITYVAKDRRDNRYCHVFDCGAVADDVLATFGQIFTILTEKKNNVGRKMPPPLPVNHPTTGNGHLMGLEALRAAPKIDDEAGEMYAEMDGEAPSLPKRVDGNNVPMVQTVLTYDDGDETYEGMDAPRVGKMAENAMYGEVADVGDAEYGEVPEEGAKNAFFNELYAEMEDQKPPPIPKKGEDVVQLLNVKVQSNHLYGDDEEDNIYGDGQIGWSYFDIQPNSDMYGTLADVIMS
eukprot:m.69954 g.69954  ORF g.69954 m.69954 type:complete len:382 (+) comp11655_c0_seq1:65-1210(+)